MLISEFYDRTGYTPDAGEWDSINAMYMSCELDKDDFCRTWCKMNRTKLAKLREETKRAEAEAKLENDLIDRVNRFVFNRQSLDYYWSKIIGTGDDLGAIYELCRSILGKRANIGDCKRFVERISEMSGITCSWSAEGWRKYWFLRDNLLPNVG